MVHNSKLVANNPAHERQPLTPEKRVWDGPSAEPAQNFCAQMRRNHPNRQGAEVGVVLETPKSVAG